MSAPVIVTDAGFAPDDFTGPIDTLETLSPASTALDLPGDVDPARLPALSGLAFIRVGFASFADGRGFTLAARLRRLGFAGRLRAAGPLIADQYAMARRAGFDEVEIPSQIAARQPEAQWRARADWRNLDYRARLRA
ncbi:MAG: DUF934 domain-containing protein [Limimaricola sp.]|uniref:DUF934 domain-containing protein n=1 Tax=Limimaricola sp. TaxID=2211665 RepID=UPI001D562DEF|nr:DUF934 domain-containing protein [Limimaricola sp.]MBI1418442.1 DUF934 domain-containing protein [Limimaricola sp.]